MSGSQKISPKRKAIWDKSGGKCWYCGCDLPERGWHADHFEPIKRDFKYVRGAGFRTTGECEYPERDTEENKVPCCASCNILKGSNSLEGFRRDIGKFVNSLNQYVNQYKFAKRYGLITETEQPVVFWFERREPHDPTK